MLGYFGKNVSRAKKAYFYFVKAGIEQGRRPELVGGGLIRSLGGWDEVKKVGWIRRVALRVMREYWATVNL